MNAKSNLISTVLCWLPFLLVDRLIKQAAMAVAPSLETWEKGSLLFRNFRNGALVLGAQGSVSAAHIAGIICFVALLAVCYFLRTPTKNLHPLIPLTFGIASNIMDSLIWGMVSDPIVIGVSNTYAVGFNLADILLVVGVIGLVVNILKDVSYTRTLYFSLEASHG